MTINQDGLWVQPGQETSFSVVGDLVTFKAVGEDTGGKYALFEFVVQPQTGPPLHIHSREDEAFYIQEGEYEFQLDDRTVVATAGTFIHSPKGQLHGFKNIGTIPAKMLCWVTPAGIEKFFAQVGQRVEDPHAPLPPVSSATIERLLVTAPKYGLNIIPPATDSSK